MATHFKPTTGGLTEHEPSPTDPSTEQTHKPAFHSAAPTRKSTNVSSLSGGTQNNGVDRPKSSTGSSAPKVGPWFDPNVILDPNDEEMWAKCTVGVPRKRSSRTWPKDANKSGRPPKGDTTIAAGAESKSDRSGQQSMNGRASTSSAISSKPTMVGCAGANQPDVGHDASENADGRSAGGTSASSGQESASGSQPGSSSWPGTSHSSGRQARKRTLTARPEYFDEAMNSSVLSGRSEDIYDPHKLKGYPEQSGSKSPRRHRLRRRSDQPPRDSSSDGKGSGEVI